MPVITRRPKTEQTTPKLMARPILEEEVSEAVLWFGVEVVDASGREEAEKVDDNDDVSFASRTVYLGNI